MLFELDLVAELGQWPQAREARRLVAENGLIPVEHGRRLVQGPQRGPERLEIRGLFRDEQVVDLAAQEFHHRTVGRDAPDQRHALLGQLRQQLKNLARHHHRQARHDFRLGNALVQRVCAVALAEHAATPGHPVRMLRRRHLHDLVQGHVHPPQLLQEELARARRALIAGVYRLDAARVVEMIDHEGLAACRDHHPVGVPRGEHLRCGALHRLGLRDRRERHAVPELPARGRHRQAFNIIETGQHRLEPHARVALVRLGLRPDHLGACSVPLDPDESDGGCPNTDSQRARKGH